MRSQARIRAGLFVISFCWPLAVLGADPAEPAPEAATPSPPAQIGLEQLANIEVPVVEAASKYKQKTTEAPSSITIITSDEIKKQGYRTLAEVLRSAPGLYVSYDRTYSFLGVRGFNLGDFNNRVLLLVDGHRMNNSLSDAAFIGNEFMIDVDLIDRVEIIRGPGSSLYGNNAFFAVINVITRRGRDMAGNGGEVSGEAGSFDTWKARATYGNRFKNGIEMLFSGTIYDSRGQGSLYSPTFDQQLPIHSARATNNGVAEGADRESYASGFASMAWQDFSLEGGLISRDKRNPTAPTGSDYNDSRAHTADDRGYANLRYAHQFEDVVDVTAQVYCDRHDTKAVYPFTAQGGPVFNDLQSAEWWGAEVQFTKRLWDRVTLTAGGEYRDDFRQQEHFTDAATGLTIGNVIETNRQNYGAYFETDVEVLTNLHANAGFRYDQYGDYDPALNPRAALIYNPVGSSVFKLIYGTAFRAPNFFELQDPRFASTLRPEKITTYELVYEQGIGDHIRSSLSGFFNRIQDYIVFEDGRYTNRADADTKSTGYLPAVQLSLEGAWGGLRSRASYTYQVTKDHDTGERLTDSPEHLANFILTVPLYKDKIFASGEVIFLSSRSTSGFDPLTQTQVAGPDAPAYGTVNLTLFSQNLVKGLDLSASVYNLFDKHYSDPSTPFHEQPLIEQDGRSFRVKLTYRF
jgi:iron complex outermembrane receptor protein